MAADSKITRTIRLTPDLDSRLIALCEHYGISIHNYLTNEIGKAVSRDEVALRSKQSTDAAMSRMLESFEALLRQQANDKDV